MKQNWEIKSLSEISVIVNGGTPDTAVKKFWDGEYLWITPKDMGKLESIYVDDTLRKITESGLKNSSAKILPPYSIILSSRAPIGHLAINTKPITTNQGCKGLVPKKEVDSLFLYYFLLKSVDLLNSLGTGTTFKELSGSKLGSVEIPLPPIEEQKRIVTILSKAFAALDKAKANSEKNLQNVRELFESYLQGLFVNNNAIWKLTHLSELCNPYKVITYGVIKLGEEIKDGVPCLRTSNVRWLKFDLTGLKRISPLLSDEYTRTILEGGEVLVNVRGTLGGVAVAHDTMKGWNVSREVAVVPIDRSLANPSFIASFIGSAEAQKWLGAVKKGAAYVGINIEDLRLLPVLLPSLQVQDMIVNKLDNISIEVKKLETCYQKKIHDLEDLRKSILHRAFIGEL